MTYGVWENDTTIDRQILMKNIFKNITIIGRPAEPTQDDVDTITHLYQYLLQKKFNVQIDPATLSLCQMNLTNGQLAHPMAHSDLMIVVGGDGSLLHASQLAIDNNIPVIGINRGRLGFLTDILPEEIEPALNSILNGDYSLEQRFLLQAQLYDGAHQLLSEQPALNDVVLSPGELTARMMSYSIYINHELVCHQRADGLIIATPTGSTAYALSAGGPILQPSLDAISLVPMFPHTLSSRPLVIHGNYHVTVKIHDNNAQAPAISCDGQRHALVEPGHRIEIFKKPEKLTLVHPLTYSYYETLRSKLGWHQKDN